MRKKINGAPNPLYKKYKKFKKNAQPTARLDEKRGFIALDGRGRSAFGRKSNLKTRCDLSFRIKMIPRYQNA